MVQSTTEPGHWSEQGYTLIMSFATMETAYQAKFCSRPDQDAFPLYLSTLLVQR